ncbi:relaxase domain-containing protein [Microbacterium aerolatum]|uniref:MobF family relaxase n=1 Tax=Microbacterium aerolatum TaxID=153731 RepID=UPI00200110C9|nr:MobF family relaxase [Microbacterium aerolatum]MCK3769777.1 relaxase domain-containing protein [Microbacterium aerolatum]
MRVLSAGEGYRYLLKSIAAGDGDRDVASSLTRYYTEAGTPPGFWLGSGLVGLGEGVLAAESVVSEEQLRRLLGHGQHPVTGEQLGRAYFAFKPMSERIATRAAKLPDGLPADEREARVERIVAEEKGRKRPRTVAGFDYTFSVPKSVSVLWAVADGGVQALIARAHHSAIGEVLDLIERDVAATRTGTNGVAQVEVRGVVATAFDHFDSRAGDPQLHTHVVIANRVQAADGKWRTLDGRPMHAVVVALSEHYNAVLADHLTRLLGVGWEERDRGRSRNPAWEITGVPESLIGEFSSRSAAIEAEKDRLIADYVARYGRQPSDTTVIRLRQQATLSTRPDKEVRSLAELTAEWRDRAERTLGEDPTTWASHLIAAGHGTRVLRADDIPLDGVAVIGAVVVDVVGMKRSTWRRWNLHAEASRQTMGLRFATIQDRESVVGLIVDAAERASLQLTPPEAVTALAGFARADGSSVFRPRHHEVFSSTRIMDSEDTLLELSRSTDAPMVPLRVVGGVVARKDPQGRVLSVEQQDAVEKIAVSSRAVDVLVGPAGTGKTTTLGALRRAWEKQHGKGSVIGLAPSSAAADVLADDLGIATENTAKWLHEHDHGRWDLRPGQLVIVDEASLAGTLGLERLASHASEAGAKVVLVGDWAQLAAVDAGGAFGLLVRDRGDAPELLDVRRFHADWEKTASLQLRLGRTEVIDTYDDQGRLVGGDYEDILDAAYRSWYSDVAEGRSSLLIAETNETVTELNARARTDRVLDGHVTADGIRLHEGNLACTGDLIITRHNDRRLTTKSGSWVKNGDRWHVLTHGDDGTLTARRAGTRHGARVVLPAAYVAEHVDLGYAVTAHRAQGSTVDTAHAIVHSSSMTRETFYVAMTRGRAANTAYVATDLAHLEEHQRLAEEPTARTVLYGVLKHEGAEKSAHETLAAEQEQWTSIAHLADQYETIAQAGQAEHVADLLQQLGLAPELIDQITDGDTYGSLVTVLRRADAAGHQPQRLLDRALRAGPLAKADDPGSLLRHRVQQLVTRTTPGRTRTGTRRRYIAGFIPEATGPMPADMTKALAELRELIEHRADALAQTAIDDRAAWLAELGPRPHGVEARERWSTAVRMVAAFRDRYTITTSSALGPVTDDTQHRLDRERLRAVIASLRTEPRRGGTVRESITRDGIG